MTPIIYEFNPVERFVAGTVGAPGERTFFIQARTGTRVVSVVVDKSQVIALGERTKIMLREIKKSDPTVVVKSNDVDDDPLEQPIFEEFRAGVIAMAWDAQNSLIVYELREITNTDDDIDDEVVFDEKDLSVDLLRVHVSPTQAASFSKRCLSLANAGRLPCPFCGIPIDPNGHLCPRSNGYRR
ncbi:MAG: hypothetical protein RLZZ190_532 [Actinomycetota bacterium]|jgi:uncharacterized repeat protein (TIGR03847 family)